MLARGLSKWAKVYKNHYDKHKKYGDKWTINLVVNEAEAKKIFDQGLSTACAYKDKETKEPIKNPDGEWEFRFTRKLRLANGTSKKAPVVQDCMKQPFEEPIGNGSDVFVQYTTYTIEGNVYDDLQGVQVLKLNSYSNDGDEFQVQEIVTEEITDAGSSEDNPYE